MPTIAADGIYYVDLSHDPDFSTGAFVSVYPEKLSFGHGLKAVGDISFELSYSALDQDGNPAVPPPSGPSNVPFIGPYRSFFRLRCGNLMIMAGPIVNTSTHYGDDFMSIAGKTWEHLLERWLYPFDPRRTPLHQLDFVIGAPPGGLVYQVPNRDIIYIWSDLFTNSMNAPHRTIAFDVSLLATPSGITTHYSFALGDMTTMMQIISDISDIGQGFDWWIGQGRKFWWATPYRYGTTGAPSYIASLSNASQGAIVDISFNNDGPEATHVMVRGAGLATQTQVGSAMTSLADAAVFGRLDKDYDVGEVKDQALVILKAQKQLSKSVQPGHTIPIKMDPSLDPNYWNTYLIGRAIHLDWDFGYHHVMSGQQLLSYQATVSEEGNALVDWTIQEIYDYSLNAGTPEG